MTQWTWDWTYRRITDCK